MKNLEAVMPKGFHRVSLELQEKWYKKHEDSIGTEFYEPMWRVEDIQSRGIKAKIKHFKDFDRAVHVLSQNELLMFMLIAWDKNIVQSYEQFALPLDETLVIAEKLGVKHPAYPQNKKIPVQQTLDFYCHLEGFGRLGYAVKQQDETFKIRTLEKLAIQEAWCAINNCGFELVSSEELKRNSVMNLERIYRNRDVPTYLMSLCSAWYENFCSVLSNDRHERVANIIEESADLTGLGYEQAVQFFHHCLWDLKITFNWELPLLLEQTGEQLGVFPNV
jgi:hypothetical protein